jgi:membrane-bound serine protease (ClpP class)
MRTLGRRPLLVVGLLLIAAGLLASCASSKPEDRVHILTWDGIVNPVMERYIDRGIDTAERSSARAVVLRLDTPGGLDSAMRDVIQRIEASRVPVLVYVSPAGSRAASAGTFITMAGHVAAMAPNTAIGAATPISSGGEDIPGALGRKVTNDAVAYIRGIAELRGRNADWAEQAVRDAVSVNENTAVELNVVDFVATSVEDLLAKADGREVKVAGPNGDPQPTTVRTLGALTTEIGTTFFEQVLYRIADPEIAFLLLSLGGLALVIELFSPGFGIGIFGVICLVLAFFALGSLPTNWAGVALIFFGLALLAVEVFVTGFGVFGIGGIAALIFGGLILTGGSDTGYQVSRWLVISFGVVAGTFVILVAGALLRMRRMASAPLDKVKLIGAKGTTRTRLDPRGYVTVEGERWEATSEEGLIEDETPIVVTQTAGLRLIVKRDPAYVRLLPAGEAPAEPRA